MLTALYIHIPFCDYICRYCDFHKAVATQDKKTKYLSAVCDELLAHSDDFSDIKTVYIGGGTPLCLTPDLLDRLLSTLRNVVDLKKLTEFTIESNPDNLTDEKIILITKYGVNRVSVGVQTFDEYQLRFLGRNHNNNDVFEGIERLKKHGIENINIDMMFSLPNQTMDDLRDDLDMLLKLSATHISYYSLILEEKTLLYRDVALGNVIMNDEEIEAEMFDYVINRLKSVGYHHYEISNFAQSNFESQHNLTYWYNGEYLGVGSGAHSHWNQKRFYHIPKVSAYINQIKSLRFEHYHVEAVDECAEACLLGLRMIDGISIDYLNERCNMDVFDRFPALKDHIDKGLLEVEDGYLKLTKKGLFLGNIVFMTFVR